MEKNSFRQKKSQNKFSTKNIYKKIAQSFRSSDGHILKYKIRWKIKRKISQQKLIPNYWNKILSKKISETKFEKNMEKTLSI